MSTESQSDIDEIHARSRSCLDAMNRGDIDAVMEHYAENAILLFSNVEPVRGAGAIRSHWESIEDPGRTARLDTESITVAGDVAYEVAFYEVDTERTQARGKNVVVWLRESDGQWRLQVDICAADS